MKLLVEPFTSESLQIHRGNEKEQKLEIAISPMFYAPTTIKAILNKFRCKRCGDCCSICSIRITQPELYNISAFLKIRPRKIKRLMDAEGLLSAPCPFLKAKNSCSIYPVRPLVCRSYPVFPYLAPELDTELPVIGIWLCPGGKELNEWLRLNIEKFRKIISQNPELQHLLTKSLPMRRQEIKQEVLVVRSIRTE